MLIEQKLTLAQDSKEWLATLAQDSEVVTLMEILDVLIFDYQRIGYRQAITEVFFWKMKIGLSDAAEILEAFHEDHSEELSTWDYSMEPWDSVTLVATLLNMAVEQFTESTINGRRTRGWEPIAERELAAIEKYQLI